MLKICISIRNKKNKFSNRWQIRSSSDEKNNPNSIELIEKQMEDKIIARQINWGFELIIHSGNTHALRYISFHMEYILISYESFIYIEFSFRRNKKSCKKNRKQERIFIITPTFILFSCKIIQSTIIPSIRRYQIQNNKFESNCIKCGDIFWIQVSINFCFRFFNISHSHFAIGWMMHWNIFRLLLFFIPNWSPLQSITNVLWCWVW